MSHPDPSVPQSARAVFRSLNADRVTAEVVDAFQTAGIRSILLKGPAFSSWLYEKEAERPYVDCDLLVAPADFDRAEAVLADLHFRRPGLDALERDWGKHARTWIREEDGGNVDLHHTFIGVGATPETLWGVLCDETDPLRVAGRDVDSLGEPGRVLLIALNAAKEASWVAKARTDLEQALGRVSPEMWLRAAQLAGRLDAVGAFTAGLRTSPEGASLAARLGVAAPPPPEIALRLGDRIPPLAAGVNWLVSTPGLRGKLGIVVRKVFPPASFMRAWSPLARRGLPGLAAAYLWRPLWLAWHALPALLAVARVRRSRRRSARNRRSA